jgi:hypothetical protein
MNAMAPSTNPTPNKLNSSYCLSIDPFKMTCKKNPHYHLQQSLFNSNFHPVVSDISSIIPSTNKHNAPMNKILPINRGKASVQITNYPPIQIPAAAEI